MELDFVPEGQHRSQVVKGIPPSQLKQLFVMLPLIMDHLPYRQVNDVIPMAQ